MVSARVVILIGLVFLYLSFGVNWVYFSATGYGVNYSDVVGYLGPYVSHGYLPDNSTIDGEIWVVLVPQLVSNGALLASVIVFPASAILGVVALFRWKLMVYSGLLALLCGGLWVWGIDLVSARVNSQLDAWLVYAGEAADSSVGSQVGPYIFAFGGLVLVAGYLLSRAEKLDHPLD